MMSVALSVGDQTWHLHTQGGANASAQLIPSIHNLLAQAQLTLTDLTALVIGQGPGSFTGLRTACSVAQGLALGANLQVIPVDTLMVVAEDARGNLQAPLTSQVSVVMDARMGEVYGGAYEWPQALSGKPLCLCKWGRLHRWRRHSSRTTPHRACWRAMVLRFTPTHFLKASPRAAMRTRWASQTFRPSDASLRSPMPWLCFVWHQLCGQLAKPLHPKVCNPCTSETKWHKPRSSVTPSRRPKRPNRQRFCKMPHDVLPRQQAH